MSRKTWASADILVLLETMQRLIPKDSKSVPYTEGLKEIDWRLVSFCPFTPAACEEKWNEILESLSKIRTLAELLAAAKVQTCKDYKGTPTKTHPTASENNQREQNNEDDDSQDMFFEDRLPPKPLLSGYFLFMEEKRKGSNKSHRYWLETWQKLNKTEKDHYNKRYKVLKVQYRLELNKYLKTLTVEQQLLAIKTADLKKTDIDKDIWASAHGHIARTRPRQTAASKENETDKICPVKMKRWLKNFDYLDGFEMTNTLQSGRTSDSEDEDFEDTSDEEDNYSNNVEAMKVQEEEEEEQDDIIFDIY